MKTYCLPRHSRQPGQSFNAQDGGNLGDETAGFTGGSGMRAQLRELCLEAGMRGDVDGHFDIEVRWCVWWLDE